MNISGTQAIAASRQTVWDALNDPQVLLRCLPGCEKVERVADDRFDVVIAAVVGPLRAKFRGSLHIQEADPPQSCVMVFEGQGGAVGFGKGSSTVTLTQAPAGTNLSYVAQAQVGGKLAQVGSRMLDGVARKMSDDFFAKLRQQLAPPAAATAPDGEQAAESGAPDASRQQAQGQASEKSGKPAWGGPVLAAAVAAAAALAVYLLMF